MAIMKTLNGYEIYDAAARNSMLGTTTSGNGRAYTATVQGINSLTTGTHFVMIPHTVSTSTTPTLNINNLGAKTLKRRLNNNASSLQDGHAASWLTANKPYMVIYDGTYWIVEGCEKQSATDIDGALPIANGGTGATTAAAALANLGITISTSAAPSTGTAGSIWIQML